ncbi:MAG: hypothetical protein K1X65_10975 [Caldilineales bacterium]|nr:hypothetical protein [Caldilineales bacterium]MCW5856730.1 hypothetical protein [Caldilineales bacterium]
MLQAVRVKQTVNLDGLLTLRLPELRGVEVEAIVVPVATKVPPEALASARLQAQTGFAQEVLADPAEDVWMFGG